VGHPAEGGDWSDEGVDGLFRFLARLWRAAAEAPDGPSEPAGTTSGSTGEPGALVRKAHWAIDKVTRDLGERFATHTSIAAVIELVNDIYRERESADPAQLRFAIATAGSLIFPFAPHLGSEVYELMTGERVWEVPWPKADAALLTSDTFELIVQMNGKLIDRIEVGTDASREELEAAARGSDRLAARLNGKAIVKTVVVPGKLVNFVVR
jgi:leucyl-tRNA synthetase